MLIFSKTLSMEKHKNSAGWAEAGYNLFAQEGLDGIQVERLARILQLNKSGFYHYFGDLEGFCIELLELHKKNVNLFLEDVFAIKKLDPDYLHLVIIHAKTVMFQVQLTRNPNNQFLYAASELVDQRVQAAVRELWCDYLHVPLDTDLGMRYYAIVRDMFYTRISFQNLNYTFLHNMVSEAKSVIDEISDCRQLEIAGPRY
jgi:AcrR family transcriptional regulator